MAKELTGEDVVERARVAAVQHAAAADRAREEARRTAHAAGVKRAQAESLIVHGPVRA